ERGVGLARVDDQREAEVRGKLAPDVAPRVAGVVASVDAPVVLQEERARPARAEPHLVDALPELRRLVAGREGRPDPRGPWPPRAPAVRRAVDAAGGGRHAHAVAVRGVGDDGVEAEAPAPRLPLRPVRVVPEAPHEVEARPAVLRAEERGRLDARPDHPRLVVPPWLELPDALD